MKIKSSVYTPIFVLVIYFLMIGSGYVSGNLIQNQDNVYLSLIALQFLVFMIPGIFFVKLRGSGYSGKMNFKLFSIGKIGFVLLSTGALICISALIRLIQYYLSGITDIPAVAYQSYMPQLSGGVADVMYVALAFAVMPAVTEEFIFRGIVWTEYAESSHGVWCSTLISALTFSMLHMDPAQSLIYVVGGIGFALIMCATNSLIAAMLSHMLFNIYIIFGEKYVFNVIKNPESLVFLIFVLIGLALLLGAAAMGEAERGFYNAGIDGRKTPSYIKAKKRMNLSRSRMFCEVFLSPSFIACIVVFILFGFDIITI